MALSKCALFALLWISAVATLASVANANAITKAGELSKDEVEASLMAELVGHLKGPGEKNERLSQLEASLSTMFGALPKDSAGRLGHSAVRYALHRLLVLRYGWFVKGLEPDGSHAAEPAVKLKEWVPSYLQEVLERRSGGKGFDLSELAVLAATLEDLIHHEAVARLEGVYEVLGLSTEQLLDPRQAEEVTSTYMMVYLLGGNFTAETYRDASSRLRIFKKKYTGWKEVEDWVQNVQKNITGSVSTDILGSIDFEQISSVAQAIGTHFGTFNDMECRDLKTTLLGIEDGRQGRVTLKEFYKMGLHSHWQFTEKVDYLRTLGALDESDPKKPLVIVPNYLGSRPQCLEASHFYAVCCRNECEDLMGSLEKELGEHLVLPDRVAELVAKLSSDTVQAPRELSVTLLNRLNQVAAANEGRVPLHGRLFAQWMHHAFPRECPFPHEAGTTSPQTPDEWMAGTGQDSTSASEEEMVCHVSGPCGGAAVPEGVEELSAGPEELPWLESEELLVEHRAAPGGGKTSSRQTSEQQTGSWLSVSRMLRTVALAGAAVGLAAVSKYVLQHTQHGDDVKTAERRRAGWWVTLALFLFPLGLITLDFLMDNSSANEFLLCGLCWALVAMIIVQVPLSQGARSSQPESLDRCLV
jgi:hypothetical protein